jgi:hypothetical protein
LYNRDVEYARDRTKKWKGVENNVVEKGREKWVKILE